LQTFQPAEVVFQKGCQAALGEQWSKRFYTYGLDPWIFDHRYAEEALLRHFGTHSLKGYGVEDMEEGIVAAGAVLHYLGDTVHPNTSHIASIHRINRDEYLWMDQFTIRNLELIYGGADGGSTLLKTIDSTVSPMGARLMRRWLLMPLVKKVQIEERATLVAAILANKEWKAGVLQSIKQCGDIERLVSKIPSRKIGPREMLQLANGLEQVSLIKAAAGEIHDPYLFRLAENLNGCLVIKERILREIAEDAPAQTVKGGYIAEGVDKDLDHYRSLAKGGKNILVEIQQREALNQFIEDRVQQCFRLLS
jgi:DNA mismatch repair protein MutS